jgi:hypothetical protein
MLRIVKPVLVVAALAVGLMTTAGHASSGYGTHANWSDGTTSGVRQTQITESSCSYLNGTKSTSATEDVVCTFTALADTQVGHVQQGVCVHTDSDTGGYRTIASQNCTATVTLRFEYTCARAANSCHGVSDDPSSTVAFSGTFQYTSPDGVNVTFGSSNLGATMAHSRIHVTATNIAVSSFDTFVEHLDLTFPCNCKPGGATPHYGGYAGSLLFGRVNGVQ